MVAFYLIAFIEIKLVGAIIAHIAVEFGGLTALFGSYGIDIPEKLLSEAFALVFFRNINMVRLTGSPGVMSGHKPKAEDPDEFLLEEHAEAFIVLVKHLQKPLMKDFIAETVPHQPLDQGENGRYILL